MKTIAVAGTFDSKGQEFLYVKEQIESAGFDTLMIHTGAFEPMFIPDISNADIVAAAGEDIHEVTAKQDRDYATEYLSKGMQTFLPQLYEEGRFDGIISLGGSGGTSIVTSGMQELPIGVPKVMVSTVASGNTEPYVGISNIMMIPSIVDVAGLNVISKKVFSNAAAAVTGMVSSETASSEKNKPLIAATMFGVTTPCINHAKSVLEDYGYEVLIFHATGIGGRTMEHLIANGFIDGVFDVTTTEWADEHVGGILAAGPNRLDAAAARGIPQVVSAGALDMVNFGPYDTVPEQFAGRTFYKHNPTTTLMRTNVQENKDIGKIIAGKLNQAQQATTFMLPTLGISSIDVPGQPFHGSEEDAVLFSTLREHVDTNHVEWIEMDTDINSESFATAAAETLHNHMEKAKGEKEHADTK
ncbi:Tm-1-like ATP-binding domain-containing protein [Salibacterium lacus]|uniref:Tm-1-like ATP-binding domain-containing protein n=1 Tax=Salibacterium lacus TaxID=1898109 RepID=A0ABW5T6W2_9BACI